MQFNDSGKLILRLTVAVLMAFHGISKLRHGVAWMAGPLHAHHLPAWLAYGVYIAEVVVPILLIVGFLTRPAALVIVFEMMMAMFLVLGPKTFDIDRQTGALR
jgi:putative oxidoreductase